MNALIKALVAFVLVVSVAIVVGGVSMIFQTETGTRAQATVSDCVPTGFHGGTHCTGSWVIGGSLVGGGGHVVVGTIQGAVSSDVGKTIDVTVSGDEAYTTSLVLPILLIGLGAVVAAFCGRALIKLWRLK